MELFSWVRPKTVEQIVDVPVGMRVQEPVIQRVQKTAQDPRFTNIDRIGDSPVVLRRREFATVTTRRMADAPGAQQCDCASSPPAIQGWNDMAQRLTTLKRETSGMTDGDQTDGNAERSECGKNPFECGCLDVNFESKGEKSDGRDGKG